MGTMIADNQDKVVFQSDMLAKLRRINKIDYVVFEGHYGDGPASVDFDIRMKQKYLKKQGNDLIKNNHMVLQKRLQLFFFLFEADKGAFTKDEEGVEVFEEKGKTNDYSYRIMFRMDRNVKPEKKESLIGGTAGEKLEELEAFMRENGITDADASSPVSSYMKSWKLGHPDEKK